MNYLYPGLYDLISEENYYDNRDFVSKMKKRTVEGSLSSYEIKLFGSFLDKNQPTKKTSTLVSRFLDTATTNLKQYSEKNYYNFLIQRFTTLIKEKGYKIFPVLPEELQSERNLLDLKTKIFNKNEPHKYSEITRENNTIIIFRDLNYSPFAYLKYGRPPRCVSAPAVIERIVWEASQILGISDMFTPTKTIVALDDGSPQLGNLQPAIKGTLFGKLIDSGESGSLKLGEMVKLMATILYIGAYDVHSDNIFVNEKGGPILFDNARSFCHSNGVHTFGTLLVCSFRCGLFEINTPFVPLNEEHWSLLADTVDHLSSRTEQLKSYFKTARFMKRVKNFPQCWFTPALVVKALDERVLRLKSATKPATLRDLAFAVHPELRFIYALALTYLPTPDSTLGNRHHFKCLGILKNRLRGGRLSSQDRINLQKVIFPLISAERDNLIGIILKNPRIDPKVVFEWCENPQLNFDTIFNLLIENIQIEWNSPPAVHLTNGKDIYSTFLGKAEPCYTL